MTRSDVLVCISLHYVIKARLMYMELEAFSEHGRLPNFRSDKMFMLSWSYVKQATLVSSDGTISKRILPSLNPLIAPFWELSII